MPKDGIQKSHFRGNNQGSEGKDPGGNEKSRDSEEREGGG